MSGNYIEKDGKHVLCEDVLEWGRWFEDADRTVDKTIVHVECSRPVSISTVFLGIDHNFSGEGPPILYETMVFGQKQDDEIQVRYTTREAALAGHQEIVEAVRSGTNLCEE